MSELKSYAVWDASTRWFHWINAICVIALASIGTVILNADALAVPDNPGMVTLKTVHVSFGYVLVLNLLWRIVWAFIGNRYARWSAILPGGSGYFQALRSYIAAFIAGRPEHYLGHNPAARLAVTALFLVIITQAATGLVLAGTDLFFPPFGQWIAEWVAAPGVAPETLVPYAPEMYNTAAYEEMRTYRSTFLTIHLYNFYIVVAMVILHIVAVVITELREGGNIISAMFTGRKVISGRPVDEPGNDVN